MNKTEQLFQQKKDILNIYLTAGFPKLADTVEIVLELGKAGVDMVEIGMPFSDPLADGPVIQHSSTEAIKNGIRLEMIFDQIREIRKHSQIPLILMGYLNQLDDRTIGQRVRKRHTDFHHIHPCFFQLQDNLYRICQLRKTGSQVDV